MGTQSERILICGVGNSIRGDDKVGPAAIVELKSESLGTNILLLDCGNSPRNFVRRALEFRPSRAVIITAFESGEKPGEVNILEANDVKRQLMSSRNVGLQFFIGSLQGFVEDIRIVAVQPLTTESGKGMSPECANAVHKVKEVVIGLIG